MIRLAAALTLGIALLMVIFAPRSYIYLGTDILIWGLCAMSLNLLVGYTGLVSFGHAAYFGIGAYVCGLSIKLLGWPFFLALPTSVLASGVAALVIGFFCVRLSAVYFSMLTLAFAQIVWAVAFRWNEVTGGDQGTTGIPMPKLQPLGAYVGLGHLRNDTLYFLLVTVIFIASVYVMWRLVHSPFGVGLAMVKQNPQRAAFLGLHVRRVQLTSFVIAGMFAGLSGALFGIYNRGLFPDLLYWTKGAEMLIMAVLGGIGTFFGPLIGAALILGLHQEVTAITEYWSLVLAVVLGTLVLVAPDGVAGLIMKGAATLRSRFRTGEPR